MPRLPKHSRVGKVYGMHKICSIAALWLRVADAVHDTVRVSCAHGCARQLRIPMWGFGKQNAQSGN